MVLRQGDSGGAVKGLQRELNKLGALLLIDGDFGPGTRDAVADARVSLGQPGPPEADDALQAALAALADPFPPISAAGVTFIARLEVSSPGEYRRRYKRPVWPSEKSGITIGIGCDLRFYQSAAALSADWGDRLPAAALARLSAVIGRPGSAAMLAEVADVDVPLADAVAVYIGRTLRQNLDLTRSIYPEVDALTPARRAALVSLVYNRGTSLQENDPTRREMREIRDLLAAGQLDGVPDRMDSMARLWPDLPGLIARRHDEARLWRSGFAALQLE
jgi:peptidoglycan hydrolase-like protein with peptidoglycan-binding domain